MICGKYDEVTRNGIPLIGSNNSGFAVYGAYGLEIDFQSDGYMGKMGAKITVYAMPLD